MTRFVKDLSPDEQLCEIRNIVGSCDGWVRVAFHHSIREHVKFVCESLGRKSRLQWIDEPTESLMRLLVEGK